MQNLASIQPRTSLVKFARSPRTDRPGVASNDGSDDDEEYLHDLGVNAYEQFYQAVVLLIDSYGQPTAFRNQGNQIDLTLMGFITSTVGEDMNYNEIQNVIKLCSHPSKGIMRPSFFIKKYAAFAAELELAHNEEMSEGPLHACSDLEPPIRERWALNKEYG